MKVQITCLRNVDGAQIDVTIGTIGESIGKSLTRAKNSPITQRNTRNDRCTALPSLLLLNSIIGKSYSELIPSCDSSSITTYSSCNSVSNDSSTFTGYGIGKVAGEQRSRNLSVVATNVGSIGRLPGLLQLAAEDRDRDGDKHGS